MRLTTIEKKALDFALNNISGQVFLFGSRTDDKKKGGDIDILIFSDEDAYKLSKSVAVNFFKMCESKIDVLVINPEKINPHQKAFISLQKLIVYK